MPIQSTDTVSRTFGKTIAGRRPQHQIAGQVTCREADSAGCTRSPSRLQAAPTAFVIDSLVTGLAWPITRHPTTIETISRARQRPLARHQTVVKICGNTALAVTLNLLYACARNCPSGSNARPPSAVADAAGS